MCGKFVAVSRRIWEKFAVKNCGPYHDGDDDDDDDDDDVC